MTSWFHLHARCQVTARAQRAIQLYQFSNNKKNPNHETSMMRTLYMLRNTFFAVLAVLAAVASSQAATISHSSSPTVGMPGFNTFTLTATTDAGEKIIGFNFVGAGELGFTGPMNQVNPLGSASVFNDSNAFFPLVGANESQDSQFKVGSTKGLAVGPSEGPSHLRGAFNFTAANIATDASNVWAFAQIAIQGANRVDYVGDLTIRGPNGDRLERFSDFLIIPEPATMTMIGLAMIGLVGFARRRAA